VKATVSLSAPLLRKVKALTAREDEAEVAQPTIVSESGRTIAAYHSVLVFNVLGVTGFGDGDSLPEIPDDVEQPLTDLKETLRGLSNKNLLESFHDAQQALDSALNLFSLRYLPLQQRSWADFTL
jgi:arginine decarboxylase